MYRFFSISSHALIYDKEHIRDIQKHVCELWKMTNENMKNYSHTPFSFSSVAQIHNMCY